MGWRSRPESSSGSSSGIILMQRLRVQTGPREALKDLKCSNLFYFFFFSVVLFALGYFISHLPFLSNPPLSFRYLFWLVCVGFF